MEFINAHQHTRVGVDGLKWGVESMCVGGGQGMAMVIERLS